MTETATAAERPADRSLLIVENDKCALQSLAQTMEAFGFTVTTAELVADGLQQIERAGPAFAVVELTFADGHGLALISALKLRRPGTRAIVLTSHGDIATAVEAVKLGAVDYLIKPANANGNDVCAALLGADVSTSDSTGKTDARRPCALGAHSEYLRTLRPQCLGDLAPAQHASAHIAAHPGATLPEVIVSVNTGLGCRTRRSAGASGNIAGSRNRRPPPRNA